jgi:hypothetical protein
MENQDDESVWEIYSALKCNFQIIDLDILIPKYVSNAEVSGRSSATDIPLLEQLTRDELCTVHTQKSLNVVTMYSRP